MLVSPFSLPPISHAPDTPRGLQSTQAISLKGAQRAEQAFMEKTEEIGRGNLEPRTFIEANQQSTLYSLNLKLFSISDEMTGHVLDLKA